MGTLPCQGAHDRRYNLRKDGPLPNKKEEEMETKNTSYRRRPPRACSAARLAAVNWTR